MKLDEFTIGQMSKLNGVPIKTLRYYDEIGLFQPHKVDATTGYRYYTLEQIKKLDLILFLKNIGIPLREIQENIEKNTLEQFINMLQKYKNESEKKILELQHIQNHLNKKIHELSSLQIYRQYNQPIIKNMSARKVIQVNTPLKNIQDIEPLLRKIKHGTQSTLPIVIGNVGYIISSEGSSPFYEGLFVTIEDEQKLPVELVYTLPAGEYAFFYVNTDYEHIRSTCIELLSYLESIGREPNGPFYIRNIVNSFLSNNKEEWIKEIQISVKPLVVQ